MGGGGSNVPPRHTIGPLLRVANQYLSPDRFVVEHNLAFIFESPWTLSMMVFAFFFFCFFIEALTFTMFPFQLLYDLLLNFLNIWLNRIKDKIFGLYLSSNRFFVEDNLAFIFESPWTLSMMVFVFFFGFFIQALTFTMFPFQRLYDLLLNF